MKDTQIYLGKRNKINSGLGISEQFLDMAKSDEEAAQLLYKSKHYNHAIYFYIQSMEKYIKGFICKKINATNPYFAESLRNLGHSLDKATDFFIEIVSGNDETLKHQISVQLKQDVFKNIRFSAIYNAVRYPFYTNNTYTVTEMSKEDCDTLQEIYNSLKKYIKELYTKL
jgi:HEPN domain-containing protein